MRFLAMFKRLFSLRTAAKDCQKELARVEEARRPVVEPIRKKIEERARESQPPLVTNGNH
jgi:hypothetical protein